MKFHVEARGALGAHRRRSWGAVLHVNELLELFGVRRLPRGLGVSFTYNDSNSFRPSEVGRDINGEQFPAPSGETEDYGVLITALDNKISLRVNWFAAVLLAFEITSGSAPS